LLGRELREARLNRGLSQAVAGRAIDVSASTWSRFERGAATGVSVVDLARALAVVGLDLGVRAYPGGQPVRDHAHLALLARLRRSLGPGARWHTEVPLPLPGDHRAWDALIVIERVRIGVEAETRVRDLQELERRLALKHRDGAVDHVILLLAATRHNRLLVREQGERLLASFPVAGRAALERLAMPADPGGSAIILL
jgi:transcriptional regulator with XRE-family HTH domain